MKPVGAAEKKIYCCLVPMGHQWGEIHERSDKEHSELSEVTTLPVDFWRLTFDFGTLLHHLFCHSSTVIKHRDDAQDEFSTHTQSYVLANAMRPSLQRMSAAHYDSMSRHRLVDKNITTGSLFTLQRYI